MNAKNILRFRNQDNELVAIMGEVATIPVSSSVGLEFHVAAAATFLRGKCPSVIFLVNDQLNWTEVLARIDMYIKAASLELEIVANPEIRRLEILLKPGTPI